MALVAVWLVGLGTSAGQIPSATIRGGVQMPVIALGTGGYDNETAATAIAAAYKAGIRHVHTAYDYFNLPGVGRAVAALPSRDSMFVSAMTSPCVHPAAPPMRNITDPAACYDVTKAELNEVLGLLGVAHVDLMMLHGPSEPFGSIGPCSRSACALNAAQWRAYTDFLHEGKARAIGVSNYCQSCINCLLGKNASTPSGVEVEVPAVNQIQVHVGMGADPEGLLSYCRQAGIVVQAYSPLAAGAVVSDPLCATVGAGVNKSAAQVGLRWVWQHGSAFVVKASNPAYLLEDTDVFDWGLTTTDMQSLDAATSPSGQQDGRPSWGCSA